MVSLPLLAASSETIWSSTGSLTVSVCYDDNVYLQESGRLADRGSWITTVQPRLGLSASGATAKGSITYSPEITRYHDESIESFTAHRIAHVASGRLGKFEWEETGSVLFNDGPDESVTYDGVGGAPAIGGYTTRDRRDALVLRNQVKGLWSHDQILLRSVGSIYLHDFRSAKHDVPGYQNHSDRSDASIGADIGRRLNGELIAFTGVRLGHWNHQRLFGRGAAYDNDYVRVVACAEGAVRTDLKVLAVLGPGWHHFGEHTALDFRSRTHWFADVTATYSPTKRDQLALILKRCIQPSGSGGAISRDTIADVNWRHSFSSKTDGSVGLRAYRCDFEAPVVRDDVIITPTIRVTYAVNPRWAMDVACGWDDADSRVPNTPAREFHRWLLSMSMRLTTW